jgi:hypothetical protein
MNGSKSARRCPSRFFPYADAQHVGGLFRQVRQNHVFIYADFTPALIGKILNVFG